MGKYYDLKSLTAKANDIYKIVIKDGAKAKRACARFARCAPCASCSHYETCKRLSYPLPRLGRYVAHIEEVVEQATALLPQGVKSWRGRVTMLPASLEDDASILLKLKVNAGNHYRTILLTGSESDYIIIKQIMRAWREAYLGV